MTPPLPAFSETVRTPPGFPLPRERALTQGTRGRILTHAQVWSPDSQWLVHDLRHREDVFDGHRIEAVHVPTGRIQTLFEAPGKAVCGVATWHPSEPEVYFILGPLRPDPSWEYGPSRRSGAGVRLDAIPGSESFFWLHAQDYAPHHTRGALRGGSHVHMAHPSEPWISFTYDDEILARPGHHPLPDAAPGRPSGREKNQRNVGILRLGQPVAVPTSHPRNHPGRGEARIVTRTHDDPVPGSDTIRRAFEEAWVGTHGYLRPDGTRQNLALAFQGEVIHDDGTAHVEVFIVDIPDGLMELPDISPAEPVQGTDATRPRPPAGMVQRRLTHTGARRHPGIQGPRHWLRSSPDGSRIGVYFRDDLGRVQFHTISPLGGEIRPVTRLETSIESAFTWSPDGRWVTFVADRSVFLVDVGPGEAYRMTPRAPEGWGPTHHACVFSPDGRSIAYMRPVATDSGKADHIHVLELFPDRPTE